MKWLLLSCGLASALSFAAAGGGGLARKDCPDFDFSAQLGPVGRQGSSTMCHAFVASDLITVNQKIGPRYHVSALDVASNVTVADPDLALAKLPKPASLSQLALQQDFAGRLKMVQEFLFNTKTDMRLGLPDLDVLAYNLRPDICVESDLPSQNPPGLPSQEDYLFNKVRPTYDRQDPAFADWQLLNDCSVENSMGNLVNFAESFGRALQRESDRELRKSCRHPLPLKPMVAHNVDVAEGQASSLIVSQFRRGAVVAIAYDGGVLHGGKAVRADSDHTSTIVASRWNAKQNRCEFKLRNSEGPYCKAYRKDWQCKKGQLWVPSANLDQMATSLYYVDPQK